MSETNGKSNGKPLNKRDKNGKIVKGAVLNPNGRGAGNPNKFTVAVRQALSKTGVKYLARLRSTAIKELNTRDMVLAMFQKRILNYYELAERYDEARMEEDSKRMTRLVKDMAAMEKKLTITLPGISTAELYAKFLLRIIPQEKNVNVNIDKREQFLVTLLGLKGKDSLDAYEAYLTDDLKELNGGHDEEHNDND